MRRLRVSPAIPHTVAVERHVYLHRVVRAAYRLPQGRERIHAVGHAIGQHPRTPAAIKYRVYNFLVPDAPVAPVQFRAAIDGGRAVTMRMPVDDWGGGLIYYRGCDAFEPATNRLFRKLARKSTHVFDAGANTGYYSLLAASVMVRGEVYSFEPNPSTFAHLEASVHLNPDLRIHPYPLALSDEDAAVTLFPPLDPRMHGVATLLEGFGPEPQGEGIRVQGVRFDTFCREHSIPRVSLLKIDVEGSELRVLRGMGDLLDEWLPDIICEVLPPFAAELDAFFEGKPYTKYHLTDEGLKREATLFAHPHYMNWYLAPRRRDADWKPAG